YRSRKVRFLHLPVSDYNQLFQAQRLFFHHHVDDLPTRYWDHLCLHPDKGKNQDGISGNARNRIAPVGVGNRSAGSSLHDYRHTVETAVDIGYSAADIHGSVSANGLTPLFALFDVNYAVLDVVGQ